MHSLHNWNFDSYEPGLPPLTRAFQSLYVGYTRLLSYLKSSCAQFAERVSRAFDWFCQLDPVLPLVYLIPLHHVEIHWAYCLQDIYYLEHLIRLVRVDPCDQVNGSCIQCLEVRQSRYAERGNSEYIWTWKTNTIRYEAQSYPSSRPRTTLIMQLYSLQPFIYNYSAQQSKTLLWALLKTIRATDRRRH